MKTLRKYKVAVFLKTARYSVKLEKPVRRWHKCYTFNFPTKKEAIVYLSTISRLTLKSGKYPLFKWVLSINTKGGAKRVK